MRLASPEMRPALLLISLLGIMGCASMTSWSKRPVPVSVSAANYSQLSDEELYARIHDPANAPSEAPVVPKATKPIFYLVVPGEIYPSDVSFDTINWELEISLEPRGYFNAIYQMRAGRMPTRIDYLLRVHYGERPWLNPTVRMDRITWGNDGLVANRYKTNLISESFLHDPRVGLSPSEIASLHQLFLSLMTMTSGGERVSGLAEKLNGGLPPHDLAMDRQLARDFDQDDEASRDFFLVVVEAFKLDDVAAMKRKAPCIWATFISVPADPGRKFSKVLRTMVQTAKPYFGETTHGLQVYEVPLGKVFIGTPVEVPGAQRPPLPAGQKAP